MLVFSRGSRGQPRAVSLAALVEEFRPLLQSALPAGIELDLQLGTGLRPVRVDPLQLEQVLMNLCINARDALCASCLQPVAGPFQVLGVQDSGPGIDERVQRTIFEPFFTTKPPGQGSGMGLSMVHGLVHEYGGHLLLHSRVGQGSCFEVLLPELDGATVVAAPLARSNGEGVGGLRGRVGVVDDDPLVCEFLTDCLRQWGLEVTAWSDAEQAGSDLLASLRDWDALILDQSMPRLSGLALAEQLLAARPGLPSPCIPASSARTKSAPCTVSASACCTSRWIPVRCMTGWVAGCRAETFAQHNHHHRTWARYTGREY